MLNFKVIGLTRFGIKSESTALDADALTIRHSELSNYFYRSKQKVNRMEALSHQYILLINNMRGMVLVLTAFLSPYYENAMEAPTSSHRSYQPPNYLLFKDEREGRIDPKLETRLVYF